MSPTLLFSYADDWRTRTAIWRTYVGTDEFVRIARRAQLKEVLWIGACLLALAATAWLRVWLLLYVALCLGAWRAFKLYCYVASVRTSFFAMRPHYRNASGQEVLLRVNEEGLEEVCGEARLQAPWHAVSSFYSNDSLVTIEIEGLGWTSVRKQALRPGSPSLESLIAELEARGVVRSERPRVPW